MADSSVWATAGHELDISIMDKAYLSPHHQVPDLVTENAALKTTDILKNSHYSDR